MLSPYDLPIDIATNATLVPEDRVAELIWHLQKKGYGDREQELGYISSFFREVFARFPVLTSFEWNQYQDYNDEYYAFDLEAIKANDQYDVDVGGFNWFREEDWNYGFDWNNAWEQRQVPDAKPRYQQDGYFEAWEQLQQDLAPLKSATDVIVVFLKALYDHYRPYYFIYVFGRRARVRITRAGLAIDNRNIDYVDGDQDDRHFGA